MGNIYEMIWPECVCGPDPAAKSLTPSWPQDLPPLDIVEVGVFALSDRGAEEQHVVGVFFDKIPTVPKMFNRATFMNSLLLPPKHPNFPVRTRPHVAASKLTEQGDHAVACHIRHHGSASAANAARDTSVLPRWRLVYRYPAPGTCRALSTAPMGVSAAP